MYSYVTMTTANGKVCTDVDNNTHFQHIQWQTCTSKIHHFNLYKWPWLGSTNKSKFNIWPWPLVPTCRTTAMTSTKSTNISYYKNDIDSKSEHFKVQQWTWPKIRTFQTTTTNLIKRTNISNYNNDNDPKYENFKLQQWQSQRSKQP